MFAGCEHFLLALLSLPSDGTAAAAAALARVDMDAGAVRAYLDSKTVVPLVPSLKASEADLSPDAWAVLRAAEAAARSAAGDAGNSTDAVTCVGTNHLLLALLQAPGAAVTEVFSMAGVSTADLAIQVAAEASGFHEAPDNAAGSAGAAAQQRLAQMYKDYIASGRKEAFPDFSASDRPMTDAERDIYE